MDKKVLALLLSAISSGDSYTKEEIDTMISQLKQFEAEKVDQLPITGQKPNCIYFVPKGGGGTDKCYEYMWINERWEFIGSTEVDLSDYWTSEETIQYIDEHKYVLPEATADTLGGVKLGSQDGAVSLDSEGNIIIATTSNEDIENLFSA